MTQVTSKKLLITGGSGFIGTNLIDLALKQGISLLNIDVQPPLFRDHRHYWQQADILDMKDLKDIFAEFQPDWVVHLAARTDCDERTTVEAGYKVNTVGTENVLNAVRDTHSVSRVIITSTQYVCRPGIIPKSDCDYNPHTIYGSSKVLTELITRQAKLACTWTIIRPTNIWGPWHLRYRAQFLRMLSKGLYFHPGGRRCTKSYGYVGNVVDQIMRILQAPKHMICAKTLYVGDRPIDLLTWVNTFSKALRGKPVSVMPRSMMWLIASCGDAVSVLTGKPFLINSRRFRSMTEDYFTPVEETLHLLGETPYSLEQGVNETVKWLREFDNLTLLD